MKPLITIQPFRHYIVVITDIKNPVVLSTGFLFEKEAQDMADTLEETTLISVGLKVMLNRTPIIPSKLKANNMDLTDLQLHRLKVPYDPPAVLRKARAQERARIKRRVQKTLKKL